MIQNWVVRHLQILGEALRAVPDDIRQLAPDVPWTKIVGMRHILVHDYFGVDADIVWQVVEEDLPTLRRQLEQLLASL